MTPELLASWKRVVSGYREVPEYYEDSQAILAADAELERLRKVLEAVRAQVARLVDALCKARMLLVDVGDPTEDAEMIAEIDNILASTAHSTREWLEARVAEAVQAERERCAKVAEAIGEPQPIQRPTIAELEKILADQEDRKVYVMPDGQVTTEIPLALQIAAAIREGR